MAAPLQPGDLIAERFAIERHAGEGAMGSVFRGRDIASGQPVAVKTLFVDAPAPPPRFAREAEALAALHAEGVVRYVHHGLAPDERAFLVMEWIEGPTLAQALRERGITPLAALQLGQRLARALAAVHEAGIVHRDLKPANIMLPAGELAQACIVDFGVARIGGSGAEITTQHGQLGTPRYMAPEQIRDPHAVDGRADVFALGCVLFECLTGVPAFGGDDPVTVLAQVLFQAASEPSALIAQLPDSIDRMIGRLLAKQRDHRPDARALAVELASLLDSVLATELAALPAAPARLPTLRAPSSSSSSSAASATLTATVGVQTDAPPLRPSVERWPARLLALQAALPAVAGALIGRERQLAALLPQLERGVPLAIWGGAGMGKTRLAIELAQRALTASAAPIDAVLFVDLGSAATTADAVRLVADQAQLVLGSTEQPEALVGALLAKLGRALLVLDRVEQLAGQIEPLIRLWTGAAPRLQLIATSRVRLRTPHAFELGPLETVDVVARALAASGPVLSAAASMVLARARDALPDLPAANALDAAAADALERIARALDGIPLAIELAAARVSVLGIDGLLARLPAQLELLVSKQTDAQATTMRGAIVWSWRALSAAEQKTCMQCALFRDGFELEAAEAVVVLESGAPPLLDVLHALREQSLLVSRTARDEVLHQRLSMFGAVREFALEQLALHVPSDPVLAGAAARHARHYAARATELLGPPSAHPADPSGLATLRARDRENLIAAAQHALAAQPADVAAACRLLRALEPVLLARGASSELALLLARALSVEPEHGAIGLDAELAAARQLRARSLTPAGQLAAARAELQAARDSARQLGLSALEASIWLDLGVVHHFARELEQAQRCYETALELLARHDDVVSEARCAGNLAAIAHDRGELLEALPGYRRAIALLESASEPRLLANFCGNLALCEHELAQLDAAAASYQRALALLEPLGDARLLGITLSNVGTLELARGKLDAALARQDRACALLHDAGDPRSAGLAQGRRAVVLALQGRMEDAERVSANAERSLRRDALGSAVLALLRAFVDLGHARRALHAKAFARVESELDRAQLRAQHTEREVLHGRRLYDQCDDVRLYLALLLPELARTRAELASAQAEARGHGTA